MRVETDYEPHTPIRYSSTATYYILLATITGALLALIIHSQFGVTPRWIAVMIILASLPIFLTLAIIQRRNAPNRVRIIPCKKANITTKKSLSQKTSPISSSAPTTEATFTTALEDHIGIGIGHIDSNLQWISLNKPLADHLTVSRDSLLGQSLETSLYQQAPEIADHIHQVITSGESLLGIPIVLRSNTHSLINKVLQADLHILKNPTNADTTLLITTQDITESHTALIEHRAHSKILMHGSQNSKLNETIALVADSIEELFSRTTCLIVTNNESDGLFRPVDRPNDNHSKLSKLFEPLLPKNPDGFFTKVVQSNTPRVFAPLTAVKHQPITGRLVAAGFKSCWSHPITLSNGIVWGVCAILSTDPFMSPSPKANEHLSVLLKLVATIIERRTLLDRLTSVTKRLEHAEQVGSVGVFDWNTETNEVVWTTQMEALYGFPAKSFGKHITSWESAIPKSDAHAINRRYREIIKTKQSAFTLEHRFIHANGEIRWSFIKGGIEYDSHNQPIRVIGIATDVTERKLLETQSKADKVRLHQALDAGRLGFWDWNIQTDAIQFDGRWLSILGYNPNDMATTMRAWTELVHPEDTDRIQDKLTEHINGDNDFYECEHRLRKKDGSWIWILNRGRVIERNEDGTPLRAVGVYSDISEIYQTREKIKSESDKKDIFLATLAHELRNPLAPIRTGLEILKLETNQETIRQTHTMMSRQLLYLIRLIDDLLDISRISKGTLRLQKEQCLLSDIITPAIESSQPLLDRKKHTFSFTEPSEPITIYGDSIRLAQVLGNILKNAAKYTPDCGRITLCCKASKNQIHIIIQDSGIGIEPCQLMKIFELYYQAPGSRQYSDGGLGIGLSLTKSIVDLHGGTLKITSRGRMKGTTVKLTLPRN